MGGYETLPNTQELISNLGVLMHFLAGKLLFDTDNNA